MRRSTARRSALAAALAGSLALAGCSQGGNQVDVEVTGTPSPTATTDAPPSSDTAGATPSAPATTPTTRGFPGPPEVVGTVATGLEVPWGLDFLPGGDAIVTERDSGRVLRLSRQGKRWQVREIGTVDAAAPQGEAGLLGVAVSPSYDEDGLVYLYVSTESDNRVVRGTVRGNRLGELEAVLTGIPNGLRHDGGRLEFGPDGFLYVSTGEIGEPERAQDRDDLAGKILRITPDGDPAPGNPFDTEVWSLGHRNVQGLAFVGERLWASEFGDSAFDELNLVERGANYGWPQVEGVADPGADDAGLTDPQVTWSTDEASPSGLAFADGHLWLAALRGERLWRIEVDGDRARSPEAFFVGDHGRVRTIAVAPDGRLWLMTSNLDGRGDPGPQDDRILVVEP